MILGLLQQHNYLLCILNKDIKAEQARKWLKRPWWFSLYFTFKHCSNHIYVFYICSFSYFGYRQWLCKSPLLTCNIIWDLPWHKMEQVASDIWLISISTNQQRMLLSCTYMCSCITLPKPWMVLPTAWPWQIESIDLVDYHWLQQPTLLICTKSEISQMSLATCSLFHQSRSRILFIVIEQFMPSVYAQFN